MKNKNSHNKNDFFLAKWMADEISDTEFKNLVSNEDFLAYNKLKKGILLYERLEAPIDGSFKVLQNKIKNRNKIKVRKLSVKWIVSVAASLILFVSINSYFKTNLVLNEAGFGKQETITLIDGSEVILHSKSQLRYNSVDWKNNRELFLIGEAFFKVKKGSKFTVKTKNGDITVLGTQFNVKSNQDFFEVICYSGKVKVTNTDKSYTLTPSQGVRKINNKVESLNLEQKKPTWINGVSTYKAVPLKYVVLDLEKQFGIKFDRTKVDEELLFTGSFNHNNKEFAFATVFKAMNISYKQISDKEVVLLKN